MKPLRGEKEAVRGFAASLLLPIESVAFAVARLGVRFCKNGYFRALLEQLKIRRAFRSRWTKKSLRGALRLIEVVDRVLTTAAVPYMAYAGTLLGQQRHGAVIPWDDDLDLCVGGEDLPRFLELKEVFRREGVEMVFANGCYKLYWKGGGRIDSKTHWNWPFIDIFVWDRKGSRLVIRHFGDHYPFACFHPLQRGRFHHLHLPIPREPAPVLASWYGADFMNSVLSPSYNHRQEKIEPRRQIASTYPLPSWKQFLSSQHRPARVLNEMLLQAAVDFLNNCGVEFWLDYGTLLGELRNHNHLSHHADVDLSMMEDAFPLLRQHQNLLDPAYEFYESTHRHDGPKGGITHRRFGGNCDFYTYRRLDNCLLRICLGKEWRGSMDARDIPPSLIFPLERARLGQLSLLRPVRTREYLEHRYGFIGHPAVRLDDDSGHYRSAWKQTAWVEEAPQSRTILSSVAS